MSNSNDGTDSLFIEIKSDVTKNPVLEIAGSRVSITKSPFLYEVNSSLFIGTDELAFRIVNDDYTGDYFKILKIKNLDGNLILKQNSNFIYELGLIKSGGDGGGGTVSVKVGSTTTLPAGHSASVVNTGNDENVVLEFSIPQGADGKTPQMMINSDGHLIAIY